MVLLLHDVACQVYTASRFTKFYCAKTFLKFQTKQINFHDLWVCRFNSCRISTSTHLSCYHVFFEVPNFKCQRMHACKVRSLSTYRWNAFVGKVEFENVRDLISYSWHLYCFQFLRYEREPRERWVNVTEYLWTYMYSQSERWKNQNNYFPKD